MKQIDDKIIKKLLIKQVGNKHLLITNRLKIPWLKKHNLYEYLINRYKDVNNIQEILYLIDNNYSQKPTYIVCKTCGKHINPEFKSFLLGYKLYCSYKCSINDKSKISIQSQKNVTDQSILDVLIDKNGNLISTYISQRWLKEHGYYEYLINRYDDNSIGSIQEIIYRIKHNIDIIPKCPVCGKSVKFKRFHEGYRKYCSSYCKTHSQDWINEVQEKRRKTFNNGWDSKGYNLITDPNDMDNFIVYDQCKIHNPFSIKKTTFYNRYDDETITLCPICNPERNPDTSIEQIIEQILIDNNILFNKHDRSIISPKELDFYIPEFNLAIECNGMFWHSGEKRKHVAIEKLEKCKQKNIKLLTFWEDDIKYRKESIINIIKTNLQKNKRIYARLCQIKEISSKESKQFLDMYHIQGNINAKVKLGLFYNDELLEVMTFGHKRKALGSNNDNNDIWELYRLCTKTGITVIGGASKLLKYFETNYNPTTIISYCHNEISDGSVYEKLGFIFDKECGQGFSYFNNKISKKRINRFVLRKDKIDDKSGKTADQILAEQGYLKCYDSGVKKYIKIV